MRVFQIIFELASCARQDFGDEILEESGDIKLPSSLSIKTPTKQLFPDNQQSASINSCEIFIRSMLLRAQYGGMKCDVQMLHSFARIWLRRFQSVNIPTSLARSISSDTAKSEHICWIDLPKILHAKARQKSEEIVTSSIVCTGGLQKLSSTDICSAGIDFHCSSVVDYLLSQHELYISLSERLARLNIEKQVLIDRDFISGQLKSMIWNFSSGINHRRSLLENKNNQDSDTKAMWNEIVKAPFDCYTKQFVRDRLAY